MRHYILSYLVFMAATVLGFAQGAVSATQPSGGGPSPSEVSNSLFDMEKGDKLSQASEMMKKKGFQNLDDNRLMRARFDRYLALPVEEKKVKDYVAILDRIESLLSPQNINSANYFSNQQEAFNLLFKAAESDLDAGNSLTIASQVKKVWAIKEDYRSMQVNATQLELLRQKQTQMILNTAQKIEETNDEANKAAAGNKQAARSATGTTELGFRVKDEARTQAEMLKNNAEMSALALKAQVEFQSQFVAFLLARRFRHTSISVAFYRNLFKGSNQGVKVGAKEMKEFFPLSDFTPTLESIDTVAREAINDVKLGMRSVDDHIKRDEKYAAFERLQETFLLGEFEPSLMTFDPASKREMYELYKEFRVVQQLIDERDLANVEGGVNKIKGRARDFPFGAVILSKVTNAMNASNMSLLSAKGAALSGDNAKAEAALERAALIWPQNPGVKDFATQVVSRQDTLAQKIPEFDRLFAESKWRDIYNKKLEYALALAQDKERSEKLRKVVNRVGELDANIQKASVLASQNNPYLAWDVIVEVYKTESDDLVLAKTRSDIAPLVANYAQLIGLAEKLEKDGAEAAALTAWLSAQDLNPASPACGAAVKRLAKSVAESAVIRATAAVPAPPAAGDEVPVPPRK
jgi:hypothetical protein